MLQHPALHWRECERIDNFGKAKLNVIESETL